MLPLVEVAMDKNETEQRCGYYEHHGSTLQDHRRTTEPRKDESDAPITLKHCTEVIHEPACLHDSTRKDETPE
jgi:hypothetical protein